VPWPTPVKPGAVYANQAFASLLFSASSIPAEYLILLRKFDIALKEEYVFEWI
jgi:hypothetical protein